MYASTDIKYEGDVQVGRHDRRSRPIDTTSKFLIKKFFELRTAKVAEQMPQAAD